MKNILIPIALVTLFVASCKSEKKSETPIEEAVVEVAQPQLLEGATHSVDVASSILTWKGFKPTGTHNGSLNLKEGAVVADSTGIVKGVFVIDMTSLKVLDLAEGTKENTDLTGHLQSPDFFNVAENPTAFFAFDTVETKNGVTSFVGELTIKGITKPITIPVKISEKDGITTLSAAPFKVDRTEFDIKYGSKKFFDDLKDKFINDQFEVGFDVKLTK